MNMEDLRLSRIEEKLDKLADAVVSLARMEERMLTLFKRIDHYEEQQEKLEVRVNGLEIEDAGKNSVIKVIEKLTWLIVGIALAFFTDLLKR
jgi:predicted RNase H-like nuclease (RuvC/YqgF family)